ncbi:hypothetical protein KCP74_01885 [Salmonella enterica subsp. enterica]|nr:hypothetical protein KCP74_01885 [Salmonella enterica subsp. enterica]
MGRRKRILQYSHGALALLAFDHRPERKIVNALIISGCVMTLKEEDIVESSLGEIVPGSLVYGPWK